MLAFIIIIILLTILLYINNYNKKNNKINSNQYGGNKKLNIKSRKDCEAYIHKWRVEGKICDDTEEHRNARIQCQLLPSDCVEPIIADVIGKYGKDKEGNYINADINHDEGTYILTKKKKLDKKHKKNFCLSGNINNLSINPKKLKKRNMPKPLIQMISENNILKDINNKPPGQCNDEPWAHDKLSCFDVVANMKNIGEICRDSDYYKLGLKACNTLSDQQIKTLSDPKNPNALFYNITRKLISGEERGCKDKLKGCEHFNERQCKSDWFSDRCKYDDKSNKCRPHYVTPDNCNLDKVVKNPHTKSYLKDLCNKGTIESYRKANRIIEKIVLRRLKPTKIDEEVPCRSTANIKHNLLSQQDKFDIHRLCENNYNEEVTKIIRAVDFGDKNHGPKILARLKQTNPEYFLDYR